MPSQHRAALAVLQHGWMLICVESNRRQGGCRRGGQVRAARERHRPGVGVRPRYTTPKSLPSSPLPSLFESVAGVLCTGAGKQVDNRAASGVRDARGPPKDP